jgi:hypothetical protein
MSEQPDEWDGVCACGKAAMDGKQCALGATHQGPKVEADVAAPSMEDMLA